MKLTTKQQQFIDLLPKQNMNVSECCKQLKMSRSTYYEWLGKSDTFKQKRNDAEESLYDLVESKIDEPRQSIGAFLRQEPDKT